MEKSVIFWWIEHTTIWCTHMMSLTSHRQNIWSEITWNKWFGVLVQVLLLSVSSLWAQWMVLNIWRCCKKNLFLQINMHKCSSFIHDGAPFHRCCKSVDYLKARKISVHDCSRNVTDWNPMENLWNLLKTKSMKDIQVVKRKSHCSYQAHVVYNHLCRVCNALVSSMPTRLQAETYNLSGSTNWL